MTTSISKTNNTCSPPLYQICLGPLAYLECYSKNPQSSTTLHKSSTSLCASWCYSFSPRQQTQTHFTHCVNAHQTCPSTRNPPPPYNTNNLPNICGVGPPRSHCLPLQTHPNPVNTCFSGTIGVRRTRTTLHTLIATQKAYTH